MRRAILRLSATCLSIGCLLFSQSVAALSQSDTNALYGDWANYVSGVGGSCGASTTSVGSGNTSGLGSDFANPQNVGVAFNFLVANGYTGPQAAGIVGNLTQESQVNPTDAGGGIAQWIGSRYPAMVAFVTAEGKDPNSLQGQLDYLLNELNTSESGAATAVKATSTPGDAAQAFELNYERAGVPAMANRINYANEIYQALGSSAGSGTVTTASSGPTCSCTGNAAQTTGNGAHTIVLDPGHASQANEMVDPATDEPVFDYSNPVEQQQVWDLSQDLTKKLQALGYTVLNTKTAEDDTSTNLKQRAVVGNNAGAALGVSIHTTPGSPAVGNDVFYPNVGDYLVKVNGQHDVYTNQSLANTDKADATTMATDLSQAEPGVTFKANSYANLYGPISRTENGVVMQGTMLVTQYFATVPWVYAEQYQDAGNGTVSAASLQAYEAGILKGIQDIVPAPSGGSGSATSGSVTTGNCAPVSCNQGTGPALGDAKILCEAEKYNGIYYRWGGGHEAYSTFVAGCPDPSNPPNNVPTGGPDGTSPSPCGTDCSGLVSVAIDGAFGQNFTMTVDNYSGLMTGSGAQYWEAIPISQAQAGDIVTTNAGGGTIGDGHVEIVDHVQGNTVYTFGSHAGGVKTGPTSAPASYWTQGAWHWTGPGSS